MRLGVLGISLLVACGTPSEGGACSVAGTGVGEVHATVDGAAWTSSATWLAAGSSVQVNAPAADGWWFSMVLQTTADGTAAADAVEAAAFPFTVDLGGDGGWVTVYPDAGDSYSSRDGEGGTATLVEDGDGLGACFAFGARSEAGETVAVEDGTLVAVPSAVR